MQNPLEDPKVQNFYFALQCNPKASADEIKKNYQRLAKEHHPDKGALNPDHFLLINKAYQVLKDAEKRRDYDATLLEDSCSEFGLIYMVLRKNEIHLDVEGNALFPCRCGSNFVIQNEHLNEDECVIECGECSNSILIR